MFSRSWMRATEVRRRRWLDAHQFETLGWVTRTGNRLPRRTDGPLGPSQLRENTCRNDTQDGLNVRYRTTRTARQVRIWIDESS